MANIIITKRYRCSDDCKQGGCPGHTLHLKYLSVTDTYLVQIDEEAEVYHDSNELSALIDALKELRLQRVDAIKVA